MTIARLFKQARLDYKIFKENVQNPVEERNTVVIPEQESPSIIVEKTPEIVVCKAPDTVVEEASETCGNPETLKSKHLRQETISSVQSKSSYGTTDHLIKKVPTSLKIRKSITIWSDFVIWLVTFLLVLLIDVSAGIYAGLVLIVLLHGLKF